MVTAASAREYRAEKPALLNDGALNEIKGLGGVLTQTNSAGPDSQGFEVKAQTDERASDF